MWAYYGHKLNDHKRAETVKSIDRVLDAANARRMTLGLIDMPQYEAGIRIRALDKLTTEQFVALLELPDDRRQGQLRAMDAAQQHSHALLDVRPVARSEFDDRTLYRWWCACGVEARGDYYGGAAARGAWEEHAGITRAPAPTDDDRERRQCAWEGCTRGRGSARRWFVVREERQNQQYCCIACRDADPDRRQRPALFGTED